MSSRAADSLFSSMGAAVAGLLLCLALVTMACVAVVPEPDIAATAESQARDEGSSGSAGSQHATSALVLEAAPDGDRTPPLLAEATATPPADAGSTALPAVEDSASPEQPPPATATETPPPPAATPTPVPQPANYPSDFLALLNELRTSRGAGPLAMDASIGLAAAGWARYMAQTNFFGHYGPDGSTPASRMAAAGFQGRFAGEALGAGQGSPAEALSSLLTSPPHAAILLDPGATLAGVGYYYEPRSAYGHYWVVKTGR